VEKFTQTPTPDQGTRELLGNSAEDGKLIVTSIIGKGGRSRTAYGE
jgi:hypothetical protein